MALSKLNGVVVIGFWQHVEVQWSSENKREFVLHKIPSSHMKQTVIQVRKKIISSSELTDKALLSQDWERKH